nr:exodeoxyribonuclease V subunit alpha [Actinotalea sp. Marseille-Q4924]
MTTDTSERPAGDARLAVLATGVLATYNRAGVLTTADVHVAQRLARLKGEQDEKVVLAVALAVRALRQGAVCVELADRGVLTTTEADEAVEDLPWYEPTEWAAALEASRLVAVGPVEDLADVRPARWVAGRLYLDRYWRDEQVVRTALDERLRAGPGREVVHDASPRSGAALEPAAVRAAVTRLFPEAQDDRQRLAAATAALSRVTVLTGGPGTGKTTTVATLLAVLQEVGGGDLRIALAAPTGKAAARLQEAVHAVVRGLPEPDRRRVGEPAATTVHRLLGWRSTTRFRHDRTHRLPHDVVVVDETSMVSLPLMARLLEALRPQARLVLVGDPDQLASVEAGAVLGDLVARPPADDDPGSRDTVDLPTRLAAVVPGDVPDDPAELRALRNGVVRLTRVHRYHGALAELAEAIRRGDGDAALAVMRGGATDVELVESAHLGELGHLTDDDVAGVRADVVATGTALVDAARAGDAAEALRALESHRLLVAHRRGPAGVSTWADRAERWVADAVQEDLTGPWPLGLPLLVTTNDRDTGLSNGDTGVVVDDGRGGRTVAFGDPDSPRLVRPHRLPAVQVVHAMTVHRGQGSQFRRVSVVLPPATSPLLTRELLYTAVTRAREHVRVVGTEEAIRVAVARPIRRASGLREPLPTTPPPG